MIILGIVITSLPDHLKAPGMAMYSIMEIGFGITIAPFIYGEIYEKTKHKTPKLAMQLVYYYLILGVILLLIGMIIRYKDFNQKEVEKNHHLKNYLKNKTEPRIFFPNIDTERLDTLEQFETEMP